MNSAYKRELLTYFQTFLTLHKKERMATVIQNRTRMLTVVIENMMHEHNASALIRTAECFGLQDLHIVQDTGSFRASIGVTQGSAQWIQLHRHRTTQHAFEILRHDGYRIVALTPHVTGIQLTGFQMLGKTACVFGTEKEGLSEYAQQHADVHVTIPMVGFTESLNVSVSAGIALYQLAQQMYVHGAWQLSEAEQIDVLLAWCRKIVRGSRQLEQRWAEGIRGS